MTECLFRGKRADTGGWIEGYYVRKTADGGSVDVIFSDEMPYLVNGATVGRVLEYMDMNGELLCEGDIIQSKDYHGKRMGVVGFSGPMSIPFLFGVDGYSDEYLFNESNIVIVGNIHDNPDLVRE